MPTRFRPYDPDQGLLLPPSLREWLSEGHLAYFIADTIDSLDLRVFYARYEGDGRRNSPYDPRMMVKLLVYGYATGCFSSRKMAKRLEEDVAFRMLAANNRPAHRTLCEFRARHLEEFRGLFVQVLQLAQEAGLVKLGRVAVDGTKMQANASRHKSMSYKEMKKQEKRLRAEITELLERAAAIDEEEDRLYGEDNRGDELPEELRRREDRLRKIQEAKQRLEERQARADRAKGRHPGDERKSPRGGRPFKREFGVPEDRAQDNFTDPESRIMKDSKGFEQCYNAQLAVDESSQIIIATGITNNASDAEQLLPMVDRIESLNGSAPDQLLADSGYRSEENFQKLEERKIDSFISLGREGKKAKPLGPGLAASKRMLAKLETMAGREAYSRRKAIAEAPVGWIKSALNFRQFSMRGMSKVAAEWDLVSLAVNLRRMSSIAAA